MRTGTAQQQPDAAGITQHHRTDPQQSQADAVRAGNGECRVAQRQAAQSLHQRIGQTRQQLPELIRPESVAGRPISEEIHLLVLDPILHVPAGAVQPGVEITVRLRRQVGHHEARVGPPGGMLGLHDHPPRPVPGDCESISMNLSSRLSCRCYACRQSRQPQGLPQCQIDATGRCSPEAR